MSAYSNKRRFSLLSVAILAGLASGQVAAQVSTPEQPDEEQATAATDLDTVLVTGSRIRRLDTTTPAPVNMITQEALTDRGYFQVGQALNDLTLSKPSYPITPGRGDVITSAHQYPNLFGLGPGRTLTLVNGRRFVASAPGLSANMVDANIIPTGLLRQVEIVQGGGASVYGSDAIAGVVNYVLRDDFEGVEVDAQTGLSSRDDYPTHSFRTTLGRSFADGRGNVAANFEWSRTDSLLQRDRPASARGVSTSLLPNPADTGPDDGIPAYQLGYDQSFLSFNANGVVFNTPAPVPAFLTTRNGVPFAAGGTPLQFGADGQVIGYDPGTPGIIPWAFGGEGSKWVDMYGLYAKMERRIANLIGHYDLTDRVRVSTELTYANTQAEAPISSLAVSTVANASGPIPFTRDHPFLTPAAIAELTAARPAFGAGAPLFLSKIFPDLLQGSSGEHETDTLRALVAFDGDFDLGDRNYYWSVSASHGRVENRSRTWGIVADRYQRAINVARNGAGEIVCAINAATVVDPDCVPINPFGAGNVDPRVRPYVNARFGDNYENRQSNYLATLGGSLFTLPAGDVSFSVAYERRQEQASFSPHDNTAQALGMEQVPVEGQSGRYHTNEYSAEFLVPFFGGAATLPGVHSLELSGAYRIVDNSIAGRENVWNAGLRWGLSEHLTLRASRSRNFRAPSLSELIMPTTVELTGARIDPCDPRWIDRGPSPAVRRANCVAEWAANPGYGDLAAFTNANVNVAATPTLTGGNRELKNEVSDTVTWGVVWQPAFAPGLTLVADRVEVKLTNGLSLFEPFNFLETCYDSSQPSAEMCGAFTRGPDGQFTQLTMRTVNAGRVSFEGETYTVNYNFSPAFLGGGRGAGSIELNLEATHVSLLETSVTGFDLTRSDGTPVQPDWVARFDARLAKGPWRIGYSANYLPSVRVNNTDTIENTPVPVIGSNLRHSLSFQYAVDDKLSLRGGVDNLTDESPSFPTLTHGDIIGRYFYLGIRFKY